MSDKVAKAYTVMKADAERMLADAVIRDGLKGIGANLQLVFHLYDEWRKLADKEKL